MTTENLVPNGIGAYTQFSFQFPVVGDHYDKVADAVDATYVYTDDAVNYQVDTYALPAHAGAGAIANVRVFYRLTSYSGGMSYEKSAIYTHGVLYYGAEHGQLYGWTEFTDDWAVNPYTGAPWTWDEIDALEVGVAGKGAGGGAVTLTRVYVIVTYYAMTGAVWGFFTWG